MNFKWWIMTLLIAFGCQSNKDQSHICRPAPPPPKFGLDFRPPTLPPSFVPDKSKISEIQINPVPHPFRLMIGEYAVWINRKKVHLNNDQLKNLMATFNLPEEKPKDTAQIHMGKGWLRPFEINEQ